MDILHFDLQTYCQDYQRTIYKSVQIMNDTIVRLRHNQQNSPQLYAFHEIVFGNLFQREIIFKYLGQYGAKLNMYNPRLVELIIDQYRTELLDSNYIPILLEFSSEQELLNRFQEHAKAYLYELFNKLDGFTFYRLDELVITLNNGSVIQPVVYSRYAGRILQIDYFKISPIDRTTSMHILYPPDMVLILQYLQHNTKVRFLRVHNMYNNLKSVIDVRKYKKLLANKRDFKLIYERLLNTNPNDYAEQLGKYIPSMWQYQCYQCSLRNVCFQHQYKLSKSIFV